MTGPPGAGVLLSSAACSIDRAARWETGVGVGYRACVTTPPNIVVLDGHTLNPGDLDWSPLSAVGSCTIFDRTAPADTVDRAMDAEVVLTNKTVLDANTIAALPRLRCIGVLATGTNVVDVAAAAKRGVVVTNAPAYGTRSVAQATFAAILELCNHVGRHAASVTAGNWSRSPDFCYWEQPIIELAGRTLGVVGHGAIGRAVVELGRAFGMHIIVATRRGTPERGVEVLALDELFARADVISLHCPLTSDNERFVDARRIALMKPDALLINTARGGLLDEAAVAHALASGRLAGAAVDVLSQEPPPADNPLLSAPNCIVTPHVAWASRQARQRLLDIVVDNVTAFLHGKPTNVVAPV